ncbi:branched-chain amino acid ABC transporter permease (plasmid) [Tistrella bauzanensis]|uniref:branched-chain amino acid ABC transporter permease n=1 Tax=Tistrella TaxID=171436 RepID=UPI0031F6DF89
MPASTASFRLLAAAVLAGLLLPWCLSGFQVFQATQILIYAVAILGLNLLTGYSGQISLGHGAFYAIGAYGTAILMVHGGWSWWSAVPAAAALAFLAGLALGLPALRLEGHYLALATFALAIAIPQLLKHDALADWTGGVAGLYVTRPEVPGWLPLDADRWIYHIALAVAVIAFVTTHNLLSGRIGRALTAIRDNPLAAEAMGIDLHVYKCLTFGISALLTGLAGGVSALAIEFVAPESFPIYLSVFLLVGLVVGGVGTVPGAVLGAAFIVLAPNLATQVSTAATGVVFGVFVVVFMYALPAGSWGLITRGWHHLGRWAGRGDANPPTPSPVPAGKPARRRRSGPRRGDHG